MTIIKKQLEYECFCCDGIGKINHKKCPTCKGSGIVKDHINYYIDDVQKIAIDGENGA